MQDSPNIYLRQICLVARELEPVLDGLTRLLELRPCYTDPGVGEFGLHNVLLPVGTNFLEIVAPVEKSTAAGRYLDRRKGDGGYMVICQVATKKEQDLVLQNAQKAKVRVAWQSNNEEFHCMQLHPRDMGGAFFEVDWDVQSDFFGSWHPAGGAGWQEDHHTSSVLRVTAVGIQSEQPQKVASHWSAVSGISLLPDSSELILPFANAHLKFFAIKDNRGAGLVEVDIEVKNIKRILEKAIKSEFLSGDNYVYIGGVRFNLTEVAG